MNIYVSNKLKFLEDELKNRGHNIILDNKKDNSIDIIVCDLKNEDISKILKENINIEQNQILIIDSKNKSIEEIEGIMNNRSHNRF